MEHLLTTRVVRKYLDSSLADEEVHELRDGTPDFS